MSGTSSISDFGSVGQVTRLFCEVTGPIYLENEPAHVMLTISPDQKKRILELSAVCARYGLSGVDFRLGHQDFFANDDLVADLKLNLSRTGVADFFDSLESIRSLPEVTPVEMEPAQCYVTDSGFVIYSRSLGIDGSFVFKTPEIPFYVFNSTHSVNAGSRYVWLCASGIRTPLFDPA